MQSVGCGMINIGQSCFFNACFQALFHIPIVNVRLQKMEIGKCTCISTDIVKCFKKTHTKGYRSPFNSSALYKIMKRGGNADLLNGKIQDAHEFWMRIIESIEGLKCCQELKGLFSHDFISIVKCEICDYESPTDYQGTGHIILIHGKNSVQDAVNDYFLEETIEDYVCPVCLQCSAKKNFFFKTAPMCLVLVLGRFDNGLKKFNKAVQLTGKLNLSDKILANEPARLNYSLVSTINHHGTKCSNGHYTTNSYCSNNIYEFDDANVRSINASCGSNAYILIYELTKVQPIVAVSKTIDKAMDVGTSDGTLDKHENMQLTLEINDDYDVQFNDYDVDELIEMDNDGIENADIDLTEIRDTESNDLQGENDIRRIQYESNLTPTACHQGLFQEESDNNKHYEPIENPDNQYEENVPLRGHRIVDMAFVFEQMQYINKHADECDSKMVYAKETKLGFRSIFHFECSECGVFHKIQSSSRNDVSMNVNKMATLGVTSIGSGFYHLEEFCAHLNIPCMSSSTFENEQKMLQKEWWELGRYHSRIALQEEINYAIATGNNDSAGNALITVITDGSWGKRSYGKGFSSLSGCAVIVGAYTKKVIYYGVKNKYCHTCTISYANFCPPNEHECNISYVGPSSGMETEIIVDGFKACELLGARFNKIISDGDSSTFKEIRESLIYRNPDIVVEKFECVNHLYKNARKKIDALSSDTKFAINDRKLLKSSLGKTTFILNVVTS